MNDDSGFLPFNIWQVSRMVTMDEDGVGTSVLVLLASDQHDVEYRIVLHPQTALRLTVDLIEIAIES